MLACVAFAALLKAGDRPILLAHYMPWFASKPISGQWGWHWTMGKLHPDERGVPLASHLRPLLGAYDSGDPDLIECHLQLMKLAGIDGVLVDWYGLADHFDYAVNQRNTMRMQAACLRLKMKFGLVFEDETVNQLVKAKKLSPDQTVAHGKQMFDWLEGHWFNQDNYIRDNGKPLFLVFGPRYYTDEQWKGLLSGRNVSFYSLKNRVPSASGAFDWPFPKEGLKAQIDFNRKVAGLEVGIPVVFPRFHDYYAEAGVQPSWGSLPDDDGKTFALTLRNAIATGRPFVQIATWNDWGEGTFIEPSVEFGYRDLEVVQQFRRSKDPGFGFRPEHLRLPVAIYRLRKSPVAVKLRDKLDKISAILEAGKVSEAKMEIERLKQG